MKTYTAIVIWMIWTRGDYLQKSLTVRNIKAKSIIEAGDIALSKHTQKICSSISCIWEDWQPQKRQSCATHRLS
jgi:hypothetical protein